MSPIWNQRSWNIEEPGDDVEQEALRREGEHDDEEGRPDEGLHRVGAEQHAEREERREHVRDEATVVRPSEIAVSRCLSDAMMPESSTPGPCFRSPRSTKNVARRPAPRLTSHASPKSASTTTRPPKGGDSGVCSFRKSTSEDTAKWATLPMCSIRPPLHSAADDPPRSRHRPRLRRRRSSSSTVARRAADHPEPDRARPLRRPAQLRPADHRAGLVGDDLLAEPGRRSASTASATARDHCTTRSRSPTRARCSVPRVWDLLRRRAGTWSCSASRRPTRSRP